MTAISPTLPVPADSPAPRRGDVREDAPDGQFANMLERIAEPGRRQTETRGRNPIAEPKQPSGREKPGAGPNPDRPAVTPSAEQAQAEQLPGAPSTDDTGSETGDAETGRSRRHDAPEQTDPDPYQSGLAAVGLAPIAPSGGSRVAPDGDALDRADAASASGADPGDPVQRDEFASEQFATTAGAQGARSLAGQIGQERTAGDLADKASIEHDTEQRPTPGKPDRSAARAPTPADTATLMRDAAGPVGEPAGGDGREAIDSDASTSGSEPADEVDAHSLSAATAAAARNAVSAAVTGTATYPGASTRSGRSARPEGIRGTGVESTRPQVTGERQITTARTHAHAANPSPRADTAAPALPPTVIPRLPGTPSVASMRDEHAGAALAEIASLTRTDPDAASGSAPAQAASLMMTPLPPALSAPPQLLLATPVHSPAFPQALADQVGVAINLDMSQAELVLTPQDLGPVRIELAIDGNAAHIHFSAAHADTRHAIEQSIAQLRDMLSAQGLALADAQVGSGFRRQAPDTPPGASWPRIASDERAPAQTSGLLRPTNVAPHPNALVDLFA